MTKVFLLLAMIFAHIVDDYYLQGWLASAKQREWWIKNAPEPLYRYDYVAALIMHSMSWSFVILLPIAFSNKFCVDAIFAVAFLANTVVHGFVDNLKANRKKISLIQDQMIHCVQIIVTFMVLVINH